MTRYVRREPGSREHRIAAVVAIGMATAVGALTFYLTRTLLARDATPGQGSGVALRGARAEVGTGSRAALVETVEGAADASAR